MALVKLAWQGFIQNLSVVMLLVLVLREVWKMKAAQIVMADHIDGLDASEVHQMIRFRFGKGGD